MILLNIKNLNTFIHYCFFNRASLYLAQDCFLNKMFVITFMLNQYCDTHPCILHIQIILELRKIQKLFFLHSYR